MCVCVGGWVYVCEGVVGCMFVKGGGWVYVCEGGGWVYVCEGEWLGVCVRELVEHIYVTVYNFFSDTIIHSLHPHVDTQLYSIMLS